MCTATRIMMLKLMRHITLVLTMILCINYYRFTSITRRIDYDINRNLWFATLSDQSSRPFTVRVQLVVLLRSVLHVIHYLRRMKRRSIVQYSHIKSLHKETWQPLYRLPRLVHRLRTLRRTSVVRSMLPHSTWILRRLLRHASLRLQACIQHIILIIIRTSNLLLHATATKCPPATVKPRSRPVLLDQVPVRSVSRHTLRLFPINAIRILDRKVRLLLAISTIRESSHQRFHAVPHAVAHIMMSRRLAILKSAARPISRLLRIAEDGTQRAILTCSVRCRRPSRAVI